MGTTFMMTDEAKATSPRRFGALRTVLAVVVIVAVVATAVITYLEWTQGAAERADAVDNALFVPILVTPSVQVADGQALLFKATNVSDTPHGIRLMLYYEQEKDPSLFRDFPKIGAGMTVSYVHEPAKGKVTLGEIALEAPRPVRAIFQPLPDDDPGALRNIVAVAQIVRFRKDGTNTQLVDTPVVVPVNQCTFELRGFLSHTGGRWHWNCAQPMLPINPRWHGGIGASGGL
jgi:hypothetical protein